MGRIAGVAGLMLLAGVFVGGGVMQMVHDPLTAAVFFAAAFASFGIGMWIYYRPKVEKDMKCEKCGADLAAPATACAACGHLAVHAP